MNANFALSARRIAPVLLAAAIALCVAGPARADDVPDAAAQEVLVKSTLLTLNDANVTGDYAVLHARLSKPFREQFDAAKLQDVFRSFAAKGVDIKIIVAKPLVEDADAAIDDNGVLRLRGHFETAPKQVKYQLGFIPSEGEWKPVAIKVDVE